MKILQSFWSAPYGQTEPSRLKYSVKGPWLDGKYNLMSWALSCLKFKEFYNKVELVTDGPGKALLIDELGLPYTKVTTDLDNLSCVAPTYLWSLGKVYSYSLQNEPFIHADGDILIYKKFPRRIENAQLVAQSIDKDGPTYKLMLHEIFENFLTIPDGFKNSSPYMASNAGIMGGQNFTFFKTFYQKVKEFLSANEAKFSSISLQHLNIIFEQYYFYLLASQHSIKIEHLFIEEDDTDHERLNYHDIPHHAWYFHPISRFKSNILYCNQIEMLLRLEYPEYHSRILKMFKSTSVAVDFLNLNEYRLMEKKIQQYFFKKFKSNSLTWRQFDKSEIFKTKFRLTKTANINSAKTSSGEEISELIYVDPLTRKTKSILLEEWDKLLIYFKKPNSVDQVLSQFLEYDSWTNVRRNEVRKIVLSNLCRCMFYFSAIEIVSKHARKKERKQSKLSNKPQVKSPK